MASWVVCSSPDQLVLVQAQVRDIVLCSWARHFTLTVPLSNQVINGTGKFNTGGLASHPGGSKSTPSRFMLQKPEISVGLMGHLAHMQTRLKNRPSCFFMITSHTLLGI